ncbi:hypothetical protein [Archangium lansingense]|uniref:Uncharacterized protein n=1 Tax=Archangium lansingense TaxID=2995310 RepID=A0ABT4A928_9BACT|nr:hypothetical protein [Archangium lansinium]MCY1078166.1 hypothetical protein [Archangium lansinium]
MPESDAHCSVHSAAEPVHVVPLPHDMYTSSVDVPPQPASIPTAINPAMIALRIL